MSGFFESLRTSGAESAPQESEKVTVTKRVTNGMEGLSWVERTRTRQIPLDDAWRSLANRKPYWETLIGSQGARKDVSAVILLSTDDRKPLLRWSTKTANHDLLWDPDDGKLLPTAGLSIHSAHGKRLIYIEGCDGNNSQDTSSTDAAHGVMDLLAFVVNAIPDDQEIDVIATDQAGNEFVNTRGDLPADSPNRTLIEKVRANG